MRVRPNRNPTESRRRSGALRRRQSAERTEPSSAPPEEVDLSDERRARESGGPEDRAMYTCMCGYVFEAEVSTSVSCPHCGAAQAW
jgi:rubrerythrin